MRAFAKAVVAAAAGGGGGKGEDEATSAFATVESEEAAAAAAAAATGAAAGGTTEGSSSSASSAAASSSSSGASAAVPQCMVQPVWAELAGAKRVLVAGCGGGYDFLSALPVFLALRSVPEVEEVVLGNLTFTRNTTDEFLDGVERVNECCVKVTPDSRRTSSGWTVEAETYWPELMVSRWFKEERNEDVPVYMFDRTGVVPLRAAYAAIVKKHDIDAIVVVDGGTDSLMRGDEDGLGTPAEDMMTIGAVSGLAAPAAGRRFLFCLGLGVDCFHGVNHAHFLENVGALAREGAFLGSWSLMPHHEEARITRDCYLASQPANSIVTSSVMSAVDGQFGNVHHPATARRTEGSKLFISALMSQYWAFRLGPVADRVLYLDQLEDTKTDGEVRRAIHEYLNRTHYKAGEYVGSRPASLANIPY